jgi:hypothetical protein
MPEPREREEARPAAKLDLSSGLVWESPASPTAPERGSMKYGRTPALKTRGGTGFTPPPNDPTRQAHVSEAPASAPRTHEAETAPPPRRHETPRVEAEVREAQTPLGVDASRYRAAEAPASRFASETPSAWDEDPQEHD